MTFIDRLSKVPILNMNYSIAEREYVRFYHSPNPFWYVCCRVPFSETWNSQE
ncbi:hypothetical protein EniLVp02_0177 [Vibrio phage EniLVp02]